MSGRDIADYRCRYGRLSGEADCEFPAMLCEHHGGHDACAVREMQLERRYANALEKVDALRAADIHDTWATARQDPNEIIAALLEWAAQMGGWDAPIWDEAKAYMDDERGPQTKD